MMALLRVKRRACEDPIDVLLLACKKQKTEDPTFSSTVFKFAATVTETDKDKDLYTHVNNIKETYNSDESGFPNYKKRQVADITDKLRAENKLFSQNNRLKVINCYRKVDGEGSEQEVTVIDIENNKPDEITNEAPKDSHSSAEKQPSTSEHYVYDLYYSNEGEFDEIQIENMLSAHAVDELMFDFSSQNDVQEEIFVDDEDDSNDENNWRNDYPDEPSDDSSAEDENEIRLAMRMNNMNLDGEYESDLSSDREDEALLYDDEDAQRDYYCNSCSDDESDDSDYMD